MVRYVFAWTPVVVVVGTAVLLSSAYLALIALMIVSLVALPALALAIVAAPYMLGRAISRHWQGRSGAHQPSAALSLAERKSR